MPGTAIGIQMNLGYPGTFARNSDCIIMNRLVNANWSQAANSTNFDNGPNFGDPVVLVVGSNTTAQIVNNMVMSVADYINANRAHQTLANSTDMSTHFVGIAVREVLTAPLSYPYAPGGIFFGGYAPGQPCDTLERGAISVICRVGTPNAGGPAFVRVVANSAVAGSVVGGFETASTGSNECLLVPNAFWTTGLKDANNVCELTLVSRNLP